MTQSETELLNALLDCEHKVWQAVVHKNSDALAALFSDDYIEITVDGKRVLKDEVVKQSPETDEIKQYAIDSEKTVRLSEESVLLSYHLWLKGTCQGEAILPRDRWATSVWTRKNGYWKCLLFQQSPFDRSQSIENCGNANFSKTNTEAPT